VCVAKRFVMFRSTAVVAAILVLLTAGTNAVTADTADAATAEADVATADAVTGVTGVHEADKAAVDALIALNWLPATFSCAGADTTKAPDTNADANDDANAVAGSAVDGGACDAAGRITCLLLANRDLHGSIPDAIGQLEYLEYLDLSHNALNSTLPDSLTADKCTRLTHLILAHNRLSLDDDDVNDNAINENLFYCTALRVLDVSNNAFKGPLSRSVQRLSKLERLDVSQNEFSGHFPPLHALTALTSLDASHNAFSHHVPGGDLAALTQLTSLRLESNSFSGSVPVQLLSLPNLESFGIKGRGDNNNDDDDDNADLCVDVAFHDALDALGEEKPKMSLLFIDGGVGLLRSCFVPPPPPSSSAPPAVLSAPTTVSMSPSVATEGVKHTGNGHFFPHKGEPWSLGFKLFFVVVGVLVVGSVSFLVVPCLRKRRFRTMQPRTERRHRSFFSLNDDSDYANMDLDQLS
jgi:hypothetical protein